MVALLPTQSKTSWGRVIKARHQLVNIRHKLEISEAFDIVHAAETTALPFGLGRSYGDSNLNDGSALLDMRGLDKFIEFDRERGILRAESGVSLEEILNVVVPHGFFLHTTPGTRFVTLGGAVANDVHGKNHHSAGSFCENVLAIGLERSDRGCITNTPENNAELFAATVGGLGMTGIITWVELKLARIPSTQLKQTTISFSNIDEFFSLIETESESYEHTVAWVDCTAKGADLGRGVFTGSNWANHGGYQVHKEGGPRIPMDAPGFMLNPVTLKVFNSAYHWRQVTKPTHSTTHYSGAFYPLDSIKEWNRIYGSKGFYQYQSVIPNDVAKDATREMLSIISSSGDGSMLAVLKTFGSKAGRGILSFPHPGATLALDFRNRGQKTLNLLARLDAVVSAAKGRLYPAKDGRLPASMFKQGYPEWEKIEALRDPLISSTFWRRVTQQ